MIINNNYTYTYYEEELEWQSIKLDDDNNSYFIFVECSTE